MSERSHRPRLGTATAALMTLGLIFAPAATSQGNPHGTPPGQVGKGASNPANGPSVASSGSGDSHVPPGQAKKQAPVATSPPAPSQPAAPSSANPGKPAKTPKSTDSQAKGNPNAPGQIKKAAATAASPVTIATKKTSPSQVKTLVRAVPATPVTATQTPAGTASAASVTPVSVTTPATPSTSTGRPAARGRKPPAARRSTSQHRSSHRGSTGARRTSTGGTGAGASTGRRAAHSAAPATARARPLAPLTAAGTAGAASVAGRAPAPRPGQTRSRPVGGAVHSAGPIQRLISTLIPVTLPVPDWSKPIILALVLMCVALGLRGWLTSRRARRLESQRLRLADDLEALQPALVPEIPASFGPLAVSVAYRPADGPAAGGDFYDVFPVGGNRVAMMVGDVSGHGRQALTRAAHMRYMLRAYLDTGLDPRSALKLAGRVLGADDEALFTTVAVAVYDRPASMITYASAGHPPPIMLGPGAHQPLFTASPALGWGEPTGRRQTTVPFGDRARACFFSDGVTEVRTNAGLLGRTQLTHELEHSETATDLLERVQRRASVIRDDMASCIVEAHAGVPVSEVRVEEFEVEMRHLDAGHGRRFLEECGVSAENANSTLAQARLIVTDSGSALLRVEMANGTAAASAGGSAPVSLTTPPSMTPADRWASESPLVS